VNTLWLTSLLKARLAGLSAKEFPKKTKNQKLLTAALSLSQTNTDFQPSPKAVARRAYFNYLNEGSIPGRDEKHWLEAEAQLFAEIAHVLHAHPN